MPKLKQFTVTVSNKHSDSETEIAIMPNVVHAGNDAPNWIYERGTRRYRFQTKKGVRRFFERRFDNVELN